MRYVPLHERILCTPIDDAARTSRGGVIIPDIAANHRVLAFALVTATGAGRVNAEGVTVPLTVKPGDVVAYPRKAANALPLVDDHGQETTTLMILERDVVAIVYDLPRDTGLIGADGRALLGMTPVSLAKADSSYKHEEELDIAKRAGWDDTDAVDDVV